MSMFFEVRDYNKLSECSNLLLDIDGTLTGPDGHLTEEIAWQLTNLGSRGIYLNFITGRDRGWMEKHAISVFKKYVRFYQHRGQFRFYCESGCVRLEVNGEGRIDERVPRLIDDHIIQQPAVRGKLNALAHDPGSDGNGLKTYFPSQPLAVDEEFGWDANDRALVFPGGKQAPTLPQFVASRAKRVIITLEIIRKLRPGYCPTFDLGPSVRCVEQAIEEIGCANEIAVEKVATALNIVPVVNGKVLGKSWAAGVALQEVYTELQKGIEWSQILSRTLAFGDGEADFEFTRPDLPTEAAEALRTRPPQIVFVGPPSGLPKYDDKAGRYELLKNMVIQGTGHDSLVVNYPQIMFLQSCGARVASEVLERLMIWEKFRPFG